MPKKIKLEGYFKKTLKEKVLLEIEILDDDLKKIESGKTTLEECIHDYAFDYNYEVIDLLNSEVIDNEIKEISYTKYRIK